jgi:4-aminobutyrate aminotransferase-like enzyme
LVPAALARGVSTVAKDASSVGFSPPLTIDEAEIDLALDRLATAAA